MSFALIFPGQGSQAVGMGKELAEAFPAAKAVFDEVDAALGEKLSDLIWDGPIETLTLTANAQPALMAVSLAAVRALEAGFGVKVSQAAFVAGHSLGEYSALAAAGALSVTDAARLLRKRGEAMQAAVPAGQGAMAALIGKVDVEIAEAIAAEGSAAGVVVVANDNNAGNVVISGTKAGVEAAIAAAKTKGVKAISLPVSAPFHSPLMAACCCRDGSCACGGKHQQAGCAGGGECDGAAGERSGGNPQAARGAGDGPRALARVRAMDGERMAA